MTCLFILWANAERKYLAGYKKHNEDGERLPSFTTPSLPLKIGYALDSVASLVHGYG